MEAQVCKSPYSVLFGSQPMNRPQVSPVIQIEGVLKKVKEIDTFLPLLILSSFPFLLMAYWWMVVGLSTLPAHIN